MVERVAFVDVTRDAPDHHCDLTFVVGLAHMRGYDDVVAWCRDAAGRLHEQRGELGQWSPGFSRVRSVVEPDGPHHARLRDHGVERDTVERDALRRVLDRRLY